ncbi:hypothetical protein V5O48_001127 [Marasmius crinis-equi]|uniref:Uncharacterized protein n=1 Tax=Marasmius crinis-equi TaxID=585013 RepID=A0ABR3FZZ0_9AGAR
MTYGDQQITNYFSKKKENVQSAKRKRGDPSTVAAERPGSPPPKKLKHKTANPARRQAFDDKDTQVNKPAASHSNLTASTKNGPARDAQIHQTSSAAVYPTPKSTVKFNAPRETIPPALIDLTKDDDSHDPSSPAQLSAIHPALRNTTLFTPQTPVRRRNARSIYEIVPETPNHPSSPIRPRHPPTPSRKDSGDTDEGDLTSSLEVVPSSQTQEMDVTLSQINVMKVNTPRSSLNLVSSEMIVPSSQSQEQELDAAYIAKWREAHPSAPDEETIPSSQSQDEFWSHDYTVKVAPQKGKGPKLYSNEEESDPKPGPSNGLQRSDSNVSFVISIDDADLRDLFEDGGALSQAQDDRHEEIPTTTGLSQATSATESDTGDELWLQNVGNRTAVVHAVSQRSPMRSQRRRDAEGERQDQDGCVVFQHSPSRSQRRRDAERPERHVPSRSATPEWPSQLTLTGMDIDSSQWSLPPEATDFLDS